MTTAIASPRRRRLLVAAALSSALPGRAHAASFPTRPVRIVVPYSVGVGPDVVARSVAEALAQRWRQPVLVDNKPGASGIVAFADVRRTPADGQTLFLADTATMAVNPLLHATLPYDPQRDLVPLTLLFRATFVLWVGGDSRYRSLAEMQQAARAAPGRISYASLGNGHASHVAIETYARAAGLRMLHVPFKDIGALLTAVASAEVDFTVFSVNTMAPLEVQGRMRALAVAARRRLAARPELPTIVEAGGPDVVMQPWAALVAIAGTPPAVLEALQHDIGAVLTSGEVRLRAEQAGFELTPSTAQALRDRIADDTTLYAPLVEEGRIARL